MGASAAPSAAAVCLFNVDSCQYQSRHPVHVRSPCQSWAATDPASSGAALPNPGAQLLAEGDAGRAFRELAAGSAKQLDRALRFPGEDHRVLVSRSIFIADMRVINPFDFFVEPDADKMPVLYSADQRAELASYLTPEPAGPLLTALTARRSQPNGINTVDFLVALNQRIQQMIGYLVRLEPGVQTPEETLAAESGSCRDTSWLFVQILRHLGMPARFVSGYLIQLKPDIVALDGPPAPTVDFTDLHAWVEVYIPGAGWVGLRSDLGASLR